MKPNIDLTEERDFNRNRRTNTRRRAIALGVDVRHVVYEDSFISRLYTSDYVNNLIDNMDKVCDKCGKYDYFNQMKYALCKRCDDLMEEEYKEEVFLTGNRGLVNIKKNKRNIKDTRNRIIW